MLIDRRHSTTYFVSTPKKAVSIICGLPTHTILSRTGILHAQQKEPPVAWRKPGDRPSLALLRKKSQLSLHLRPNHRSRCANDSSLCCKKNCMSETNSFLFTRSLMSRSMVVESSRYRPCPALFTWPASSSERTIGMIGIKR